MSRVHRLRTADRVFFITVNLRASLSPFTAAEYALILESFQESRRRLGFLLCGYVLMPDHWHGLFWPRYPLGISRLVQDIKYVSSRRLNRHRGSSGSLWQHQFWDRFVRHAKEFNDRLMYMHLNPVRKGLVARPALGNRISSPLATWHLSLFFMAVVELPEFQPGGIGASGVPDSD